VPARAPIPELAVAAVKRYCDNKIPAEHRDEIRIEFDVRGKNISLFECRPPWRPDFGPEWTRQPIAQLRYEPDADHWRLYYADRNSRWHHYDLVEPATPLGELLAEIDDDPTGTFWG
jgi:hypothetical protein